MSINIFKCSILPRREMQMQIGTTLKYHFSPLSLTHLKMHSTDKAKDKPFHGQNEK